MARQIGVQAGGRVPLSGILLVIGASVACCAPHRNVDNTQRAQAASSYGRPVDPTALLKPANRFSEASEGSPLKPAQDALNGGDVMKAVELFHSLPVTAKDRSTSTGKHLHRALDKAFAEISGGQTNGSAQVETLNSYWRPKLEALSLKVPESPEETSRRTRDLDELALALGDSENVDLSAAEKRQRDRFRADLAAKQAKLFPVLRRVYAKQLGASLWQANGEASVADDHGRTLILSSPLFLANASIDQTERQQDAILRRLRFDRIQYRAPGGRSVQYHLNSPPDGVIGRSQGTRFVGVQ